MGAEHPQDREHMTENQSLLAFYHRETGQFSYHRDLLSYFGDALNGRLLWQYLAQNQMMEPCDAAVLREIFVSLDDTNSACYREFVLGGKCRHAFSFTYHAGQVTLFVRRLNPSCAPEQASRMDELTGLYTRNLFCDAVVRQCAEMPQIPYGLFFFDIIKFKAINDIFGFAEGDALLMHIGAILQSGALPIVSACRESADRFAFLADLSAQSAEDIISVLVEEIKQYPLPFEISLNVGIYRVQDGEESGNSMLDKAMLAQASIKGSYTTLIGYYTEHLRDAMLSEQEIAGEMNAALADGQFVAYFQPQYNHSTGMLVGAEALVRWCHPEKGMISPAQFIPIFEKNGFITKLDYCVFEQTARFLRHSMDQQYAVVPISVNFSKYDIFAPHFVDSLEEIRQKYDIPSKYLRIEITESVLTGNAKAVNEIMAQLHACGYVVEMDDFGSGYSSLNVLKDLHFDIIKLDMLFLDNDENSHRGGTILSSVINMAKWLNIPVIAEGVETVEQADFLRSIGCDYIQGYLYSKPLPADEYEALISRSYIGALIPQMNLIEPLNAANFWEPSSQETLIFSNFVGAAAIFSYDRMTGKIDILRVNQKYLRELGMNLSEHDIIHRDPIESLNERNKRVYYATLERAIETGEEQECDTWREIRSDCCGTETFCIRSTMTVIGRSNEQVLFHCMIRNITTEKQSYDSFLETERRFQMASEQVNIYFWEYTIATHEMRPCFRCMRDLGLPPVLRNYPDSVFERGIFPWDYYEMYTDWHKQIENGVKELEAIIPLTADRVPFHVRYTTEFDENGHPVKAYGSAALVVDGQTE